MYKKIKAYFLKRKLTKIAITKVRLIQSNNLIIVLKIAKKQNLL